MPAAELMVSQDPATSLASVLLKFTSVDKAKPFLRRKLMLRRTMIVVIALLVAMTAGSALAQTCTVGVYGDADGTVGFVQPIEGQTFDMYVVLFTENLVSAASYSLDIPGLNDTIFNLNVAYGPSAGGINLNSANGENVGLGECAIGFGGAPVVVAHHTMLQIVNFDGPRTITVGGNCDEDCNSPVMSSCNGTLTTCDSGASLLVDGVIATQSASFGAVKSLFNN